MAIILKNNTLSSVKWPGRLISAGGQITLSNSELSRLNNDDSFYSLLDSGEAQIYVDTKPLSALEAKSVLNKDLVVYDSEGSILATGIKSLRLSGNQNPTNLGNGELEINVGLEGRRFESVITANQSFSDSFTTILFDSVKHNSPANNFSYNSSTGQVTILKEGVYLCIARISAYENSATRTSGEHQLLRNGIPVPASNAYTYHRNSSNGNDTCAIVKLIEADVNDILEVQSRLFNGGTLGFILGEASSFTIVEVSSVGPQGPQGAPGGQDIGIYQNNVLIASNISEIDFLGFTINDAGNGRVEINAPSIFGQYYKDITKDTQETNNSNTVWSTYVTLTTDSIPAGNYRIGLDFGYAAASTSGDAEARLVVNTSNVIWQHREEHQEPGTDQVYPRGGHRKVALGAGVHTIELQYKVNGGTFTMYMKGARIEFWRVP